MKTLDYEIPDGQYDYCPQTGTHTIIFYPKFGKSFTLSADSLANLVALTDMFFAPRNNPNFTTLSEYKRAQASSLEETTDICIEDFRQAA